MQRKRTGVDLATSDIVGRLAMAAFSTYWLVCALKALAATAHPVLWRTVAIACAYLLGRLVYVRYHRFWSQWSRYRTSAAGFSTRRLLSAYNWGCLPVAIVLLLINYPHV